MSLSIDDLKEIFDKIIENLKNPERYGEYYNMELSIKKLAASNPNTPPETLEMLANDEDRNVRYLVARNPNTPPEVLEKLAYDKDWGVRYWASKNPNHLMNLSEEKKKELATILNTPPEMLAELAKDEDEDDAVRHTVAKNQNK